MIRVEMFIKMCYTGAITGRGMGLFMKILVLSDSHSSIRQMRLYVNAIKPDAIVHLGDYYDDAEVLAEEYPHIRLYQVPGNCDRYRCPPSAREILIMPVCGVNLYMTHGHRHSVKSYLGTLLRDARASRVSGVLYGHTHVADCHLESDGLWVMNPGSCGYYGGSAGLIETKNGKICNCRIIKDEDLIKP